MLPRYLNARICTVLLCFVVAILFLLVAPERHRFSFSLPSYGYRLSSDISIQAKLPYNTFPRKACVGPRGSLLTISSDDQIRNAFPDVEYPMPFGGSHDAVGLERTWHSADGRYGPYGFGEDKPGYNRSRVHWEQVNWGKLQKECLELNQDRFPTSTILSNSPRLALRQDLQTSPAERPRQPSESTGRTAIVIRTWSSYNYKQEDMIHIRSIIVEAALTNNADYEVFLLVDVKDLSRKIFDSVENYDAVLEKVVPPEFQGMAVLFDNSLLDSWYPLILERQTEYQVMQPFQIFAHFYSEFDHYWQIEMDSRFTGHSGRWFNAMSKFAKGQPRKQARERASYVYMPRVHGRYADFSAALDKSLKGGGQWGPVYMPGIQPIGPRPPTRRPQDDNFSWGVGEHADLIVLKACAEVSYMKDWVYKGWTSGFKDAGEVPRVACPPAQGRASWNLLNEIHRAQATNGYAVPSEATLPTFALWHGLKMILAPHPYYQNPEMNITEMDRFWNGGPVGSSPRNDSMGWGDGMYNAIPHLDITRTMTWAWASPFGDAIMNNWLGIENTQSKAGFPYVLHRQADQVYCPNLAIHPRKTNNNP